MTTVLFEGVLNDDTIEVVGKDNYRLTYWTYATCWSNDRHDIYFDTFDGAVRYYLRKFYGRALQQGRVWLEEDKVEDYNLTPEEYWREGVYEMCYA